MLIYRPGRAIAWLAADDIIRGGRRRRRVTGKNKHPIDERTLRLKGQTSKESRAGDTTASGGKTSRAGG